MKRSLFIAIAVLLMAALFVGCNADKSLEDQLFEVSIEEGARALQATGEFNVDINEFYWFYTATKTSGGFRTGEKTVETPIKTSNNAPAKGITGANLGSFSKGTWEFSFFGYADAADKGTEAKRVFFQVGLSQTVSSAVSLAITLTRGDGALSASTVVFDNPTWYHEDFKILPEGQTTGYALDLKVFVGTATEAWKTVSATTVDGKATFEFADTDVLTLTEETTLHFKVYWGEDLVGQEDLVIPAASSTKYTVSDLSGTPSGITPVSEDYGVIIFDVSVPGLETTEATGTISVSPTDPTVVKASVAPVSTEQTTVVFPAGSFTEDDEGSHELTIAVADVAAAAETSFVVTDVDVSGAPIAVLSFTLSDAPAAFGEYVEIETYIQTGLDPDSIKVIYNGADGKEQPKDVSYTANYGKLTFKTKHFSDYVVVSTAAVARIGSEVYESLADAIADAQSGATVTLLQNASGAGIFLGVADAKTITVDLGRHTYTCSKDPVGSSGTESQAWHLEEGNTVTIKNGELTSTATSGVLMLVQNYCNLTLDDVVLDGANIGAGQYTLSNNCGVINIIGDTSIYAPENGRAFDVCAYSSYSDGVTVNVATTGTISGKVEIDANKPYPLALNISSGLFVGSFVPTSNTTDEEMRSIITITGGTFNGVEPVAFVNNTVYGTLADAVDAVPSNNTETVIKLLKSVEGSGVKVTEGKNIVFDLNGKTYTVINPTVGSTGTETNAFQLLKGSKVTFKNGALRSEVALIFLQNYCDLTLIDVDLDCSSAEQMQYVVSNNFGSLTVTGNTIIKAHPTQVAFDVWYGMSSVYYDGITILFDDAFTGEVNGKVEFGANSASALFQDAVTNGKVGIAVANNSGVFNITPAKGSDFSFEYSAEWARSDANPFVW